MSNPQPNRQPRNRVRGPTSALSSFLRERGIVPPPMNMYSRNPTTSTPLEITPDIIPEITPENTPEIPETEEPVIVKPAKKKKKPKATDSNELDFSTIRSSHSKLTLSIRFCENCNRRFYNENPIVVKCPACLDLNNKAQKSPALKKRKRIDNELISDIVQGIPKLTDLCIKFIANHIKLVEEFGDDMPNTLKTSISKILSRNRELNDSTLELFLVPTETILNFYEFFYFNLVVRI